jgi:hypothetical protein
MCVLELHQNNAAKLIILFQARKKSAEQIEDSAKENNMAYRFDREIAMRVIHSRKHVTDSKYRPPLASFQRWSNA